MLGYYRNYKLNKKVFKKDYFNTEDLGYIDSDGYLYIVGRTKNLILGPNGENIFPEEIESLLLQSEIIKEVVISGKNFKNNVQLIANIVVNDDYLRQNSIRKNEVADYIQSIVNDVNNKVAFYKRINSFNIMDGEFEKTSTLKIKR
jgi:long-chain acyl-CoA synthetase